MGTSFASSLKLYNHQQSLQLERAISPFSGPKMQIQTFLFLPFFVLLLHSTCCFAQLHLNYYHNSCPNVESIVRAAVKQKFDQTFVTAPATLRLFFHDCFVRVLLNSSCFCFGLSFDEFWRSAFLIFWLLGDALCDRVVMLLCCFIQITTLLRRTMLRIFRSPETGSTP